MYCTESLVWIFDADMDSVTCNFESNDRRTAGRRQSYDAGLYEVLYAHTTSTC